MRAATDMNPEPGTPPSSLEIERLKVEINRLHVEQEKLYMERWRADVGATEAENLTAARAAVDVAQTALRTLFLLNGGGFIAWPTLRQLFGAALPDSDLKLALIAHGVGLTATAGAAIVGYLALATNARGAIATREVRGLRLNKSQKNAPEPRVTDEQIADAVRKADALSKRGGRYGTAGLIAVVIGWLAFVVGALLGARSLVGV